MSIFDRPSLDELLEAVIDFINQEIKSDDYPANKRFKLQIVSNVLGIVKREIESGDELSDYDDDLNDSDYELESVCESEEDYDWE